MHNIFYSTPTIDAPSFINLIIPNFACRDFLCYIHNYTNTVKLLIRVTKKNQRNDMKHFTINRRGHLRVHTCGIFRLLIRRPFLVLPSSVSSTWVSRKNCNKFLSKHWHIINFYVMSSNVKRNETISFVYNCTVMVMMIPFIRY